MLRRGLAYGERGQWAHGSFGASYSSRVIRYTNAGLPIDAEGDSTRCHGCGALLIGRDWYELTHWSLDVGGRCRACGMSCAGVFEAAPGGWGARRVPVRLLRSCPS